MTVIRRGRLLVGVPRCDVQIHGRPVDPQTRCVHYRSERDIVAIKFACCDRFYPCHRCHADTAGHVAEVWPADRRGERAVLCGGCWRTSTIEEYLGADDRCVHCGAAFNPGCRTHHHLYFA